jgi:translation initiation factor SUI1
VNRVRFQEAPQSIQEGGVVVSCPPFYQDHTTDAICCASQEFACNGTLVDDEEMGQVIQLQGDQRVKISNFLTEEGVPKTTIKLHGF